MGRCGCSLGNDHFATPLPDAILARLQFSSDAEITRLALQLPQAVRAKLAVLSFNQPCLREIGRHLAGLCDRKTLIGEAGSALGGYLIELDSAYVLQTVNARIPSKITAALIQDIATIR